MGGLVVQMLLDCGLGAAGISIDGTAPKGVYRLPLSVMKAASPVLSNPLNVNRTVMLTFEQFRYAFANTMTRAVARQLYEREVIPGPGRPIFEVAFGNFSPWAVNKIDHRDDHRAPLLLIAASEDHLVPAVLNRINWKLHMQSTAVTDYKEFPARSHIIIAQEGWAEVAEFIHQWIHTRVRGVIAAPAIS
jgi:alpha-beta hydrolase superfamily lysophospholipase